MKVSRQFVEDFNLVHATFRTAPAEIEEAKAIARADMDTAQAGYHATAAMIRAGWRPLEEHATAFLARTAFTYEEKKDA